MSGQQNCFCTCGRTFSVMIFFFWAVAPSPTENPEFARCPQQLPMSSPSLPVSSCELNKNTRRCHQQPLATHLSCRLYQTCDHAVLISGWSNSMFFLMWYINKIIHFLGLNQIHKISKYNFPHFVTMWRLSLSLSLLVPFIVLSHFLFAWLSPWLPFP